MPQLTAVTVTSAGVNISPASPFTVSEISGNDIGALGCFLYLINSNAAAVTVTVTDPGKTLAGNPGAPSPYSIPAGSQAWFLITRNHVDPATNLATVLLSTAVSVTYRLTRVPT